MSIFSKLFLPTILSAIFIFSISARPATAANFANPILKAPNDGCRAENLQSEHFNLEMNLEERLKVCQALDKITVKLNSTAWSPALSAELNGIWQIFSSEAVTLRLMPKEASSRMLAMAEAFPAGTVGSKFEACIYIRPEKSDADSFFQVLLHELRHVYDFYYTWKDKTALNSIEVERRAFLLMGKIAQESHEKVSGVPKFWKESWRNLTADEIVWKRASAVDKYLQNNNFYRELGRNQKTQALDFSFQKSAAKTDNWQFDAAAQNSASGEQLPNRPALPSTAAVLPQNVRQIGFNLEKPRNPRDEKEILHVALQNEKKLYYGMSNFVYDQKLQFQCWKKGKVSVSFSENDTVTRTDNGNALFQPNSAPLTSLNSPCTLDSQNLKTDFAETFWVSPALEKMPINFTGFVQVDGQTLARYTVLQPDARLFNELAGEYQFIKPFRVFVGTIFISPEDGQIVRFWGTSFPENTVTGGSNSKKVWGSYSVTALRQKLNIEGGLWVTVYVGTVALAEVAGNPRPFSYAVKFENYRQAATDVQILDDEETADNSLAGSK